jgi:hypothetical protein
MAKFKIQKSATVNLYADALNVIGGTGGLATITGSQIQAQVNVVQNGTQANGSLLRARGRSKFLVADTTNTIQDEALTNGNAYVVKTVGTTDWAALGGPKDAVAGDIFTCIAQNSALTTTGSAYGAQVCKLVNKLPQELSPGEMSITMDKAVLLSANLKQNGSPATSAYVTYAVGNVAGVISGPVTTSDPEVQVINNTGLNGNVVVTNVTIANGLANASISFSSQAVSNSTRDMYVTAYVGRLDNKFAHDFQGNKYPYTFSNPTATTVRLPQA